MTSGVMYDLRRFRADLWRDLGWSVREFARAPGPAIVVICTLSLGIGANVAMASLIRHFLFAPPVAVSEPARLARVLVASRAASGIRATSARSNHPMLLALRGVPEFESIAGIATTRLSLGVGPDAVDVRTALVSADFFRVMGAPAAIGRLFGRLDGLVDAATPGGPALAVLSFSLWQRSFGADSHVVGRAVRVGHLSYQVVGVAPPGFDGNMSPTPDVWIPLSVAAESEGLPGALSDRASVWLEVVARLRVGASRTRAEDRASAFLSDYLLPLGARGVDARVIVAPIIRGRGPDAPREARVALWLGGVSTLVLILACANVTNILLGRAFARRREIAVRLALGATLGRVARQLLTEGLLLAFSAAVLAIGWCYVSQRALSALFGVLDEGALDTSVLLLDVGIAVFCGAAVSLAPIVHARSLALAESLRAGGAATDRSGHRLRTGMLFVQATLCTVLLVLALLFTRSLRQVQALDLGLDVAHTLRAHIPLSSATAPAGEGPQLAEELLEMARATAGVREAALARGNPYRGGRAVAAHTLERDQDALWHEGVAEIPMEVAVGAGYFRAVGATSLLGRDFTSDDRTGSERVAIVNEPLARILWPDRDALGQCIILPVRADDHGGECVIIVGVLRGFWKYDILNRGVLAVYVPLAQSPATVPGLASYSLYVRTDLSPGLMLATLRRRLQAVRPNLPALSIATLKDVVEPELRPWRLAAGMFGLFGLLALAVGAVGVYGVVSLATRQRARDVAIRSALGAGPLRLIVGVVSSTLAAIAAGVICGLATVLVARDVIGGLLFATSASDPMILIGVTVSMLVVALTSSLVPSIRLVLRPPLRDLHAN